MNPKLDTANPMLVTELLGFHPQLLLDEIVNSANETVYHAVDSLESFLEKWIDEQEQAGEDVEKLREDMNAGLHSFQTLLESNADLAFDVFEAWCFRNIFIVDPALPITVPHQRGLELTLDESRERELQIEVDGLRRKLENMRRLYSRIRRAEAQSEYERRKAEARLQSVSFLESSAEQTTSAVPTLAKFLDELRTLPQVHKQPPLSAKASKPTGSRTGYLDWAVQKLLKGSESGASESAIATERMEQIGSPRTLMQGTQNLEVQDDDGDTSMSDVSTDTS